MADVVWLALDKELGNPYIPKALTHGGADRLVVSVAWG